MSCTNSYATLSNYTNVFMHISKPRANPTLIKCANRVYELNGDY